MKAAAEIRTTINTTLISSRKDQLTTTCWMGAPGEPSNRSALVQQPHGRRAINTPLPVPDPERGQARPAMPNGMKTCLRKLLAHG
jgi:hypothetical protein